MLNSFTFAVIVGIVMGYLSGLGIGGGSLLILWLTLILGIAHTEAKVINILFFLAAAGAASFFRWKKGSLQLGKILPAIVAGCCFAAIFAWISNQIDTEKLQKAFGLILLVAGARELFYRPKELR